MWCDIFRSAAVGLFLEAEWLESCGRGGGKLKQGGANRRAHVGGWS